MGRLISATGRRKEHRAKLVSWAGEAQEAHEGPARLAAAPAERARGRCPSIWTKAQESTASTSRRFSGYCRSLASWP